MAYLGEKYMLVKELVTQLFATTRSDDRMKSSVSGEKPNIVAAQMGGKKQVL